MTSWTVQTWVSGPPRNPSLGVKSAVETACAPVGVDFRSAVFGEHEVPPNALHWPLASSVLKHARVFATVGSGPPGFPLVLEKHWKLPGPNMLEPEDGPTHASSLTMTSNKLPSGAGVVSVLAKVVAHWTVQRCVAGSQLTPPTPETIAGPQSATVAQVWFTGLGQVLLADAPAPRLSIGLSSVVPTRMAMPEITLTVRSTIIGRILSPPQLRRLEHQPAQRGWRRRYSRPARSPSCRCSGASSRGLA